MYKPGETVWADKLSSEDLAENRRIPFGSGVGFQLAEMGAILSLLPPPPLRVLDAGCACGRLTHFLQLQGYEATGIDVCASEIEWANAAGNTVLWRGMPSCPEFSHGDYDHLPPNRFGAVVFANTLHHSTNRLATLKSVFNALTPGGICIACEPGLGHGWHKVSREWSKEMDVTERSCPPVAVAYAGLRAGFREIKVYPNPTTIHTALYGRGGHVRENSFSKLFRSVPRVASLGVLLTFKWLHGVTVMRKPPTR